MEEGYRWAIWNQYDGSIMVSRSNASIVQIAKSISHFLDKGWERDKMVLRFTPDEWDGFTRLEGVDAEASTILGLRVHVMEDVDPRSVVLNPNFLVRVRTSQELKDDPT